MARGRGKNDANSHTKKRHIERYEHAGKKRVNNPPVGLVTPETEDCRRQIVVRVSELMMSAAEPWSQLGNAHDIALEILNREFGKQHSVLLPDVSSGEIARLIGECPVGWKKPGTNA
jgi:hypothetical protein